MMSTNPQLELAFDYIQNTNKNIFLTGKAGTGKTTFLHKIKAECIKRMAVVAPTGVAAINAKGMTIHSLFQLPFGPYLPGLKQDLSRQRRFSKDKINLIRSLDLLIIDEISMVRADILDAIDDVLRRYRDYSKPFGGVQLLMIGDLHQLPPIVRPEEWDMLRDYYKTAYFFGSNALMSTAPITIQLTHIYRQSDTVFIDLLNKVRNNNINAEVLETLNSRYIENFKPTEEQGYITLTSHNTAAFRINDGKLNELSDKVFHYKAKIEGDFPSHSYPTEEKLAFKKGAQVMFIKNDASPLKQYYNGKIGKIVSIDSGRIKVKCQGDNSSISVSPVEWKNVKYSLNSKSKEVSEDEVGTFTQMPLKLAWAITIHKSQGLTFENAIIDAQSAFAHGQVYVALSRCTSFEGIVLLSEIKNHSVKTDGIVKKYSEQAERNAPTKVDLLNAKKEFQQSLILEIFDFKSTRDVIKSIQRNFLEHEHLLTTAAFNQFKEWAVKLETEVCTVGDKFKNQIHQFFGQTELPSDNAALLDRLNKGGQYFSDKIVKEQIPSLRKVPILTDNASVKELVLKNFNNLEKELFVKNACLINILKGFSTNSLIKAKSIAALDFDKVKRKNKAGEKINIPKGEKHPALYRELIEWRNAQAEDRGLKPFEIFKTRTTTDLTLVLPTDLDTLIKIKGIGKVKVKQFGKEIIDIIQAYSQKKGLVSNQISAFGVKKDSKIESLDMFNAGKSIDEIAEIRNFVRGTIEGHLGHFIKFGDVNIFDLMEQSTVDKVEKFMIANPDMASKDQFTAFKGEVSYAELRMVRNFMEFKNGEKE